MKKNKNELEYVMITEYIYLFFLTAIIGFLWEVMLSLLDEGVFRKRGFFYGPWLPIYGVGAVIMLFLLQFVSKQPVKCFCFCSVAGALVELAGGWLLNHYWGLRYWDYSENLLNLQGYICLYSVLGFGIGGTIWVCYLSKAAIKLWRRQPKDAKRYILGTLLFVFMIDVVCAFILPNTGEGITSWADW